MVFGSLIKSFMKSGEDKPVAGPLGLRTGAAVEVETIRFRMVADQLHFELPNETLFITASGRVDLGDGSVALRYYTDLHVMLQVLCVGGETDAHIQEVTLYAPFTSLYPEGTEWRDWEGDGGRIGRKTFRVKDGTEYQRIWFAEDPDWASPVRFQETVLDNDGTSKIIPQTVMLFGREIAEGPGFGEYLLVSIEEHDGERSVEHMMGVDLEPGMFRVT